MSKGKRWLAFFIGISLVSGLGFLIWPRACDESIDGRLSIGAWIDNLWARVSGGQQDCDPWSRMGQSDPIGAIKITYSINAYAGPSTTEFYVRPDGQGYVYHWDLSAGLPGWQTPETALTQIATGNFRGSFTFVDKRVYEKVQGLLAPLRHATGPIPREFQQFKESVRGKVVIHCDLDGYHSRYGIDWTWEPFSDSSYFDNSSGHDNCPALRSAVTRLDEAKRLMEVKVPQEFLERWAEEARSRTKN